MALRPMMLFMSSVLLVSVLMLQPREMDAASVYPMIQGKRFDCRVFCKLTGYHGMIGGCRCSFTLFTAKRADSLWEGQSLKGKEDSPPSYPDSGEKNSLRRSKRSVEHDFKMDYIDDMDHAASFPSMKGTISS